MADNANDEEVPRYTVVGPGAQINTVDGTAVLVTRGGPVPSNVDPEHLDHLLRSGLVAEAEPVGGLEPVLTGDHTVIVTSPVEDVAGAEVDDLVLAGVDDPDGPGGVPARSAPKAEWVAYADTVDGDDHSGLTKDELVEKYGRA